MKVLFATIVCMFLLAFVGCSTEQAPTEVTQIPTDHFDKDQPVDPGGGASVVRYEGGFWWYILDIDNNWIAMFGLDLAEACEFGIIDVVSFMEVTNPNDQNTVNQLIHGDDMHCAVYPFVPAFNLCDYLTIDPLVTGFVDMNSTDNDLYAWAAEVSHDQRVNSYKIAAQGALYDQDGQKVQANMLDKVVWTGWPEMEFINTVSFVKLAGF